jgi:hypothetical protein
MTHRKGGPGPGSTPNLSQSDVFVNCPMSCPFRLAVREAVRERNMTTVGLVADVD